MKINELIVINGLEKFKLNKGDYISRCTFPQEYGVYITADNQENVIYIGMAGTVKNDGTFKGQNIDKRLKNTRNKKSGNNFFKLLTRDNEFEYLSIYCIQRKEDELPAFLEADLMQKFFRQERKLPMLNKAF